MNVRLVDACAYVARSACGSYRQRPDCGMGSGAGNTRFTPLAQCVRTLTDAVASGHVMPIDRSCRVPPIARVSQ
jgi:hypothetical protein